MAATFIAVSDGANCGPLNPAYRAREFDYSLADLGARLLLAPVGSDSPTVLVAQQRGLPVLEFSPEPEAGAGLFTQGNGGTADSRHTPAPELARPDDVALALHTSGTSARPKLVLLTHRNLWESAHNIRAAVELTGQRPRAQHGLCLARRGRQRGLPAGSSSGLVPGLACAVSPHLYTAAPALHQLILEQARLHPELAAGSSLRFVRSASAEMPRRVMEELEQRFQAPFLEAYGMTEAAPQIASNRLRGPREPGSVGPAAGPEVAILDAAGVRLPAGKTGEVAIRGANVMRGTRTIPKRIATPSWTVGSAPATRAIWMPRASCSSPGGSRRSLPRAARRSPPVKWRRSCWTIPRWPGL